MTSVAAGPLSASIRPAEGAAPHQTATQVPDVRALRGMFRLFSRARARFDRCVDVLGAHTPAPPPYVTWNLARFARTLEFLAGPVAGPLKWVDVGSDPWFCLLAHYELGRPGVMPTGYSQTELHFTKQSGELAYQFRSSAVRVEAGFKSFGELRGLDLLSAFEVLEHLPEHPAGFLAAANAALRPGGKLVLSTPNVASWASIERLMDGATPHLTPLYGGPMDHRKEYTVWEVRTLVEAAGFRITRLHTYDVYTNDRRGWRSGVLRAGHIGWNAVTFQPRRARNLIRHGGSTTFVEAVKVSECDVESVARIRV